jgi:hypothetical protein
VKNDREKEKKRNRKVKELVKMKNATDVGNVGG